MQLQQQMLLQLHADTHLHKQYAPHKNLCMSQDEAERTNRPHKQKPAVWQHISRNIYTHRQRKVEKEDDIMICTCPQPADGAPGCGPDCLNRRLAVECHPVSDLANTCSYKLRSQWAEHRQYSTAYNINLTPLCCCMATLLSAMLVSHVRCICRIGALVEINAAIKCLLSSAMPRSTR